MTNAILIGAQKGGTTTIFDAYRGSVDVRTDYEYKDYHVFIDAAQKRSHIERIFRAGKEKVILHAGVNYMYSRSALEAISDHLDTPKILIVLRNPVERAISAVYYFKQLGLETRGLNAAIEHDLEMFPYGGFDRDKGYLEQGLYCRYIEEYVLPLFPREQVGVFLFEELFQNGRLVLKELNDFLGVDYVDNLVLKSNQKSHSRFGVINRIFFSRTRWKMWFGKILPAKLRFLIKNAVLNLNKTSANEFEALEPALRRRLREFYQEDTAALSSLLGKDLNEIWK